MEAKSNLVLCRLIDKREDGIKLEFVFDKEEFIAMLQTNPKCVLIKNTKTLELNRYMDPPTQAEKLDSVIMDMWNMLTIWMEKQELKLPLLHWSLSI
jgi:hypothetical protein